MNRIIRIAIRALSCGLYLYVGLLQGQERLPPLRTKTIPPFTKASSANAQYPSSPVSSTRLETPPNDQIKARPPIPTFRFVLEPFHFTTLYAELNSPIIKMPKRMGDSFKKDEVLVELEDQVYVAAYEKAKAILAKAESTLHAKQKLHEDKVASLVELKEAEANYTAAQAELTLAKKHLDATKVLAPYDGKVVMHFLQLYEIPHDTDTRLMEIVDDHLLLAQFLIPSSMVSKITIDSPVLLHIQETNTTVKATIKRIGAIIDPASSTLKVEAEVNNEEGKLKTGMTGYASFPELSATAPPLDQEPSSFNFREISQTSRTRD